MGGAEKVAEQMGVMFPQATLHATVALPGKIPLGLKGRDIKTTWMEWLPKIDKYYRLYFLLYPLAIRSINVTSYDLVLTSSSGYAKGVKAHRGAIHVCYCHTPMRWVWRFDDYAKHDSFGSLRLKLLKRLTSGLKRWDKAAAQQPDYFIANSNVVASRIAHVYGRTARVIPPPIDVHRFCLSEQSEDFYLVLSRLVSYKRIDVAVRACSVLGRKLLIIGTGPDLKRLKAAAGPEVNFLGRLPDAEVTRYAASCKALIFPGEEDFGMTPLELAAAGRPTIAFKAGGAVETIIDGVTGVFFESQETSSVVDAILRSEAIFWSKQTLRAHAERFSVEMFHKRLASFLREVGADI